MPLLLAAGLGLGCGADGEEATTTTTTEARLTKAEYIRQGDAICARLIQRGRAESQRRFKSQQEAAAFLGYIAEVSADVEAFKALKYPMADRATADQLNAYLDGMVRNLREVSSAVKAGNARVANAAVKEGETAGAQFSQLTNQYGFVECGKSELVATGTRGR